VNTSDRRTRETGEAAAWWVRSRILSGQPLSRAERDELTEWLRESPLHISEMLHMARVQDTLERFKLWDEIDVKTSPSAANVVSLRDDCEVDDDSVRYTFWRKPFVGFAAAAIAAAVLAVVFVPRMLGETLVTKHAERREVALGDGSTVQLDPETRLRIKLDAYERRVSLERGRAVFHVAKDKARPFLVTSNGTVVRAVGTVFGVEQRQQGVVVTVSEGKVVVLTPQLQQRGAAGKRGSADVTSAPATDKRWVADRVQQGVTGRTPIDQPSNTEAGEAGAGVFVTAGEQLRVGSSGDADAVRAVNVKQVLSWAEGYLVFDETPLSDVVAEFNHYNNVQLRLGGAELSRRPISGTFLVSDLETLIAFIEAGAHVSVTREERGHTVLITLLP